MMQKEWFSDWFDSPYYHLLYNNRDQQEAETFMKHLTDYLEISQDKKVMDLACGKGRHAIFLNKLGLDVTGLDLSPQSILFAKQYENSRLHFYEHDMRQIYAEKEFDIILNLFTSFGYFDTEKENIKAFQSAARSLKKGGKFVLDFFNTNLIIKHLEKQTTVKRDEILFEIHKKIENNIILKDISFDVSGKKYHFQERVAAISKDSFINYAQLSGLKTKAILGNYQLADFDEATSPRMIFIFEK
ncbi:MAG: class I SAM-dependent methyltransferase [Pseudarcicella sp.]|nr:class I SAM-dependent methyltransferase [Pseudarcicella sp.]MBP6409512.1 class I SAM-dependent methyltransferase [Pseudarcicella sp.]